MRHPGPTHKFPRGKLNPDDAGQLSITMGISKTRKGVIEIHFGTDLSWIGFEAPEAEAFANALLETVRQLRKLSQ